AGKASAYAREPLGWAVGQGILNGKGGGILDPRGQATRAETAAMLQRFAAMAVQ
ncbi:S-layer homology domain-containing protein, partial [Neglectibacter timonensis]